MQNLKYEKKLFKNLWSNNLRFITLKGWRPVFWYTHKSVHAATSLIINAIPNMFSYLDNSDIPYTTNKIENYFAHLKGKITLHRGLRYKAKKNFIKWYLYFKNNKM